MRGNLDTATRGEDSRGNIVSTFTFRTSERSEVTIRHALLDAGHATELPPSKIDEAFTVILHLSATDHFELHGVTNLLWSGQCTPGSVNVVARREPLTVRTPHRQEALIVGIPSSLVARVDPEARAIIGRGRDEAHDPHDAVGHGLGLAYLVAFKSASDPCPQSTSHLARAISYHFAFKYAWMGEKFASSEICAFSPWQALTAVKLLDRGNLQIREIAAACRLSSSAFYSSFRATFLRSPREWKAERRIDAVKELLLGSEASLADVALQAGFSDQTSMSRSFRRIVGASPGAWRMSRRAGQI